MTQDLNGIREKIAKLIMDTVDAYMHDYARPNKFDAADSILSYLQQPEVFDQWAREKGYVKLSDDQELPVHPKYHAEALKRAGFRRVQLNEEKRE